MNLLKKTVGLLSTLFVCVSTAGASELNNESTSAPSERFSQISVAPNGPLIADGRSSHSVVIELRDSLSRPVVGTMVKFSSDIAGDDLVQPNSLTDANGQTTGAISTTLAASVRILSVTSPQLDRVRVNLPSIAGAATQLAFVAQPQNGRAGHALPATTVVVTDRFGNLDATANGIIELSLVDGAQLTGTRKVSIVSGFATFTDLQISKSAVAYKYIASAPGLMPAYSNAFNVSP